MKTPSLLSGFAFLLILSLPACAEDIAPPAASALPAIGSTSFNWSLNTPDGVTVELDQASREKPQIVLFWATWCPYCKALMPHLQSLQLEYGDEINVLAVVIDDSGNPKKYIEKSGYDFTLLMDGSPVAQEYGLSGTPGVLIIDTNRKVRFDLRRLPGIKLSPSGKRLSNSQAAKRLAPYWGAEVRKALDTI